MKFRNDLALALATVEGVMLAVLVAMPTWLLAVIITLTVISAAAAVASIISARKASFDEETGTYGYKFPLVSFVIGVAFLAALTVAIWLVSMQLYGFALIPLAVLLAAVAALAFVKGWVVVKYTTLLIAALLVVFLINYGTSYMVHHGIDLNPGLQSSEDVNGGEKPGDVTETPDNNGNENGDNTNDNTNVGDNTQEPGNQNPGTDAPAVNVKINAPETMSYGVPITVKLEGCKADDLKYGNKDFIAISKVSDTEVTLILVGIVNDAGEVEFVPASGYITITDSVSGVNVSIEITE